MVKTIFFLLERAPLFFLPLYLVFGECVWNGKPVTFAMSESHCYGAGEALQSFKNEIYFDLNSFVLTAGAQQDMEWNVGLIKRLFECDIAQSIVVEGHADERGSAVYNFLLARKRVLAVADFLKTRGVDMKRIEIVSFGEELPKDANHSEASWKKNRRVHFLLRIDQNHRWR